MDIAAIGSLVPLKNINGINTKSSQAGIVQGNDSEGFESIFKSALDMVKQTNDLTNAAEQEEMKFALGNSDNIADLMVAQRKANISLQYTVAIRNAVMSAYREIMNLQFKIHFNTAEEKIVDEYVFRTLKKNTGQIFGILE